MGLGDSSGFQLPTGAAGCLIKGSTRPLHITSFKPTGLSESSWLRFTFTAHGQTLTQQPGRSVSSRSQYVAVLMCLTSPHLLLSPLICRIMQACIILYLAQAKLFRKYHEMASKETGNSCKFADCTSAPDLLIDADQPAGLLRTQNPGP